MIGELKLITKTSICLNLN